MTADQREDGTKKQLARPHSGAQSAAHRAREPPQTSVGGAGVPTSGEEREEPSLVRSSALLNDPGGGCFPNLGKRKSTLYEKYISYIVSDT